MRGHDASRWNTNVALVPPKPKLFDMTVVSAAPSRRIDADAQSGAAIGGGSLAGTNRDAAQCAVPRGAEVAE